MNFPIRFKNVLTKKDFIYLQDDLREWHLNNFSNMKTKEYDYSKKFFGQVDRENLMHFWKASTTISLKVKLTLKKKLHIIRLQSGGKLFGTSPNFHVDYSEQYGCYTFVLFTCMHWDTNWGGEFIAQDPETSEYKYVPYIPNTGVLIPSHWQHTGSPPLTNEAGIRTSVAFMYAPYDKVDTMLSEFPDIHKFQRG